MHNLLPVASAVLQLGLVGVIVAYSFYQIRRQGNYSVLAIMAGIGGLAILLAVLFFCSGILIQRLVSDDRLTDLGVVATATMIAVFLLSSCTSLVCLFRRTKRWRSVFLLQALASLYLAMLLSYVAMGKPFA